jgi:hypothetical protein
VPYHECGHNVLSKRLGVTVHPLAPPPPEVGSLNI